ARLQLPADPAEGKRQLLERESRLQPGARPAQRTGAARRRLDCGPGLGARRCRGRGRRDYGGDPPHSRRRSIGASDAIAGLAPPTDPAALSSTLLTVDSVYEGGQVGSVADDPLVHLG